MRLLLDTHIFLWYISGDKQLSLAWQSLLRDPANQVFLGVVSVWEASIKYDLGKLPLPAPPETYLPLQCERHLIASLSLEEAALRHLAHLPALHRDPFDRMLICQALEYDITLVTVDPAIRAYPVTVLADS
ncbi:MAG TPA: type II toxin-antitoxin system VapC family toxin [Chthonomonadaceae bacterium]|nr:type II toxin-antitoxin system VapC family toxin [Chthonomonadaceae bacterium]